MITIMDSIYNYGFGLSLLSAFIHHQINKSLWKGSLRSWLTPSVLLLNEKDIYLNWKWRNFLISFIHAFITGVGTLICMSIEPNLITDVIDTYLEPAYLLTCYSHGYFIHDTIEMIIHRNYKGNKELIVHHILILMCFSITLFHHKYVGYCSVALYVEVSNIFLHFRQLLSIAQVSKSSKVYRINSIVNIIMFILARGLGLYWLWNRLIIFHSIVPLVIKAIAYVSLVGFTIITVILFIRLINSDFKSSSQKKGVFKNGTQKNGTQKNGTQKNGTQKNGIEKNGIEKNETSKVKWNSSVQNGFNAYEADLRLRVN